MDGAELRRRRKALRMSQRELADRLGIWQQTLSGWETGRKKIEHPELLSLALDGLAFRERLEALESVTGTRYGSLVGL